MRYTATMAVIAGLLCLPLAYAETEAGNGKIEGEVELAYRNVDVDGSDQKYEEDFDGLDSGLFLGGLTANWQSAGDGWLDYARFNAVGLGGQPYEQAGMRLGKKDSWELRLDATKQDYMYNMFHLVPDEDGSFWDAERRRTNLSLDIHANDKWTFVVQYRNNQRTGDSLFLKDVSRDVFRLESPLDIESDSYVVGFDARLGKVNLVFRHMLNGFENHVVQETEGNLGIDTGNMTVLNSYHWDQRDNVDTDWTTLMINAPVHDRVELNLSLAGTLLGDTTLESSVEVEQLGVAFNGAEFGGTCMIGGAVCNNDATCDAINAGDVCVAAVGISDASQSGDTQIVDFGASFRIVDPLTAHVSYSTYSRDMAGTLDRDLDGDGTFEDLDGDSTPGSTTLIDHEIDTITALLDYQPSKKFGVRAGFRTIDRMLTRSGFGGTRDLDFRSDGDDTLIFGINARPAKWLRLNADYEDGEIAQAFTNVSYVMREQTRVRATFMPKQGARFGVAYRDWQTENLSSNFRPVPPAVDYDRMVEGTTLSADWTHRVDEHISYMLRYATQEVEGFTGIVFDTAGFGAVAPGFSDFLNDNEQVQGRLDYRRGPWGFHLMVSMAEADGFNDIIDTTVPSTPTTVNSLMIMQEFDDAEIGLDYTLSSGVRVGATYRDFDYDDVNDLLDYEGSHLVLRAGFRF